MVTVILSIAFLSIIGTFAFFIFLNYLLLKIFHLPQIPNTKTPDDFNLTYKNQFIQTAHGKKIQVWDINRDAKGPVIIGIHGWANTAEKLLPLTEQLVKNWRVILINARNHGDSDNDGYMTLLKYTEDILKTIDYVQDSQKLQQSIVVVGHSMGGAAGIYAAARDKRINGIVSISTFANLQKLLRQGFIKHRLPEGFIRSLFSYIEFRAGVKLAKISPDFTIKQFKGPALIIHGTKDQMVDFSEMNRIIKEAGRENVNKHVMKGDNHSSLLTQPELYKAVTEFLEKYFI